jgi:2-polyprenyl-3-methyl-5-hydroxy-6-metoxy-1,4-benzoquinol methylase
MLDRDILAHYERGQEHERLDTEATMELVRTQELLRRYLPAPPAVILDVGGGPGVYAAWLAREGYTVRLVDPVPVHVQQAEPLSAI